MVQLYVVVLTATLAVLTGAQESEYCSMDSCDGAPHTACIYELLPARACGIVNTSTLSKAEQNEILQAHNDHRAFVASGAEKRGKPGPQPAAKNLKPLKWDPELAVIAQTWANQCIPGHDQCHDTKRWMVGQNIASRGTSGPYSSITLKQLVKDWYEEVALLNKSEIDYFTGENFMKTGHYTQLVWADTTHVGCGVIRYNNDRRFNRVQLVCNYGPLGNFNTGPVYQSA